MHKTFAATLTAVILVGTTLAARAQDFTVTAFDSHIKVNKDASLDVKETITAVFSAPKHGIYRTIPFRYDLPDGNRRYARLSNFKAKFADGSDPGVLVTGEDKTKKIRLGKANKTVTPGKPYVYIISYHVENAFNWFDKTQDSPPWAELYWNITGNQWEAPVKSPTVTIDFPKSDDIKPLRAKMLWGTYGSTKNVQIKGLTSTQTPDGSLKLTNGQFKATLNKRLDPGMGMTVVLAMSPKAVPRKPIEEDPAGTSNGYSYSYPPEESGLPGFFGDKTPGFDYSAVAVPIIAFLGMFGVWYLLGKDAKFGPPVPLFEPPLDLGPSECGLLIDGHVNPRDVTAALVNLGVKGHVRFVTHDPHGNFAPETTSIQFTGRADRDNLTDSETVLLNLLGPESGKIASDSLKDVLGPNLNTFTQMVRLDMSTKGYFNQDAGTAGCVTGCLGVLFVAAATILGALSSPFQLGFVSYFIAGAVCLPMIMIFAAIMPRQKERAASAQYQVKCFKEAMSRRDDFMEWFSSKHLDQAKYEQYLPYAVAFGLTKTWSDLGIRMNFTTPSWATSSTVGFNAPPQDFEFFTSSFLPQLDHITATQVQEVHVSTSDGGWGSGTDSGWSSGSSGFSDFGGGGGGGGGGFSGGGGGGGGGGSW